MTVYVFVLHLTMTVFGTPDVTFVSHSKEGCEKLQKVLIGKLRENGVSFTVDPPYADYGLTIEPRCREEHRR